MKLSAIITLIDRTFPFSLQEEWDNCGLSLGDPSSDTGNILLAVDLIPEVIEEARQLGCSLIITHHPLFFGTIRNLSYRSYVGRMAHELIRAGIAHLAVHTNADSARGGINDFLAGLLGIHSCRPLSASKEPVYKIAVYVPPDHVQKVKDALVRGGASSIGNYDSCFFTAEGYGSFRGLKGSHPFLGKPDELTTVPEIKLETVCPARNLRQSIDLMLSAHPYEEAAYDIYRMEIRNRTDGIGRFAILDEELTLQNLASLLVEKGFNPEVYGSTGRRVKRLAVCCGSSSRNEVRACLSKKADVLVTGEIKYHDRLALTMEELGVITLGHDRSESVFTDIMLDLLKPGFDGEIHKSRTAVRGG